MAPNDGGVKGRKYAASVRQRSSREDTTVVRAIDSADGFVGKGNCTQHPIGIVAPE
jgi:hypothetical protein